MTKMISDLHQCIFVHLRRTGGNSIELSLGGIELLDREGKETRTWDNNLHRGRNTPHKIDYRGHYMHDTAIAIERQFPEKFKKYSKFSIIRNPWDQMISLYLRLNTGDKEAINYRRWLKYYPALAGTVPEYSLFNGKGECMVDEIGRFENLENDFIQICSRFNIKAGPLYNTNSSLKKHYAEYYDSETTEMISRIFKKDIKYFGYKFDQ